MCLKDNSSLELSKPQLFHFCVDSSLGREKGCPVIKLSLTLLFSVVLGGAVSAEEKAYKSIFDGKTLKGWTQRNGTATYRIENEVIIGKTKEGSPNSFLCSDREYGNFDLKFDVKVDEGLNSGVQIRSQTRGGYRGRVNGPQVEIESSGENGAEAGYIYGEAAGGWMTPKAKLIPHKHFKDGEWNSYRVLAKDAHIKVWINGNLISDLTHEEKFKTHPKGFIGLQVHGIGKKTGPFEVRWRNLKLKELDYPDYAMPDLVAKLQLQTRISRMNTDLPFSENPCSSLAPPGRIRCTA